MARRVGLRARLRYWFDNTMSKGTVSLIGWLGFASLILIAVVATGRFLAEQPGPNGVKPETPLDLLWQTFISAFGLAVPDNGIFAVLALAFVLGVGGIFIVSTLVGLLVTGMNTRLEQLRKGRSLVVETDHTVVLGWSDQVYTVVSELVEANLSRRKARIVILAEQDKVTMEDRLRHRLGSTRNTKVVCRTGSPLDLTDLEMVNLNAARSIIVLAPQGASIEDADAYVI